MPFNYLISLFYQSERLCDDLFIIAVEVMENPRDGDFERVCRALEGAAQRVERRKQLAGLVPIK